MILAEKCKRCICIAFPRMSGDDPTRIPYKVVYKTFSPPKRGCTQRTDRNPFAQTKKTSLSDVFLHIPFYQPS